MWYCHWCMLTFYEFTRWLLIHSLCGHVLTCHEHFNDKFKHLTSTTKVKLLWEAWAYKYILQLYCTTTWMEINFYKSLICFNCMLNHGIIGHYKSSLFHRAELHDGLKYLGFFLKPLRYAIKDRGWMIGRIEHQMQF